MKDFFKQFVRMEHTIMTTDGHVADVLRVLNQHNVSRNIDVMVSDCELGESRWWIDFAATGRQMKSIIPKLIEKDDGKIIVVKNGQ